MIEYVRRSVNAKILLIFWKGEDCMFGEYLSEKRYKNGESLCEELKKGLFSGKMTICSTRPSDKRLIKYYKKCDEITNIYMKLKESPIQKSQNNAKALLEKFNSVLKEFNKKTATAVSGRTLIDRDDEKFDKKIAKIASGETLLTMDNKEKEEATSEKETGVINATVAQLKSPGFCRGKGSRAPIKEAMKIEKQPSQQEEEVENGAREKPISHPQVPIVKQPQQEPVSSLFDELLPNGQERGVIDAIMAGLQNPEFCHKLFSKRRKQWHGGNGTMEGSISPPQEPIEEQPPQQEEAVENGAREESISSPQEPIEEPPQQQEEAQEIVDEDLLQLKSEMLELENWTLELGNLQSQLGDWQLQLEKDILKQKDDSLSGMANGIQIQNTASPLPMSAQKVPSPPPSTQQTFSDLIKERKSNLKKVDLTKKTQSPPNPEKTEDPNSITNQEISRKMASMRAGVAGAKGMNTGDIENKIKELEKKKEGGVQLSIFEKLELAELRRQLSKRMSNSKSGDQVVNQNGQSPLPQSSGANVANKPKPKPSATGRPKVDWAGRIIGTTATKVSTPVASQSHLDLIKTGKLKLKKVDQTEKPPSSLPVEENEDPNSLSIGKLLQKAAAIREANAESAGESAGESDESPSSESW